jgi:hypothetical protein
MHAELRSDPVDRPALRLKPADLPNVVSGQLGSGMVLTAPGAAGVGMAAARPVVVHLAGQRGEIVEYVRALKIVDPGLRQAVLVDAVKVAVGAVTAAGRIKGLGEGERTELQEIAGRAERGVGEIDVLLTGFCATEYRSSWSAGR